MVRATAHVKGLTDQIELVNARDDQEAYEKLNPLNKVPGLMTDDGEMLIESRLICRYLDGLKGGTRLYPENEADERRVLQQEAVIHGIMDAVVLRRMETRRSDSERSAWWDERQKRKIDIGLAQIEGDLDAYTAKPTIIPIMLGCMCHFMDRVAADDWRKDHPGLAKWYEAYAKEPHMTATETKS